MNDRALYTIRGWSYTAHCLNPFRTTVPIDGLPLGLRLNAYKRDAVGRGLYRRKIHEPALTELLLHRFAKPVDRNFIDVGANIGYFSCLMSKLAGTGGKVLSVEPEPKNFALLQQNLKLNHLTNVTVQECALGASEGSAMLGLYKPSNRGRHSIVDADSKSSIEVRVRTLDEIVMTSGNKHLNWSLMKIDVEGYEGFVLAGAKETLPRVETLVMEYSPELLKKAGLDPTSTVKALCREFSHVCRIEGGEIVQTTAEECLASEKQVELVFGR